MPTYVCRAPIELIDRPRKAALAASITRIHADVTGADGYFAQVIVAPTAEGGLLP